MGYICDYICLYMEYMDYGIMWEYDILNIRNIWNIWNTLLYMKNGLD